jgi:hypothetical protein
MGTNEKVLLRIVVESPPAGVDFGIQSGKGSTYETVGTQRSRGKDLRFEIEIGMREGSDEPRFAGPFVQGSAPNQFIYIDIGEFAGQKGGWSRRMKIPLTGISENMVRRTASGKSLLETRVPGTAKDGGPNCATVKAFPGWRCAERMKADEG